MHCFIAFASTAGFLNDCSELETPRSRTPLSFLPLSIFSSGSKVRKTSLPVWCQSPTGKDDARLKQKAKPVDNAAAAPATSTAVKSAHFRSYTSKSHTTLPEKHFLFDFEEETPSTNRPQLEGNGFYQGRR